MYGTEKRHLELRLRCALELSQNAEYYALQLHALAQEAKKSGKTKFSVNSLLSATLCQMDLLLNCSITKLRAEI